MLDPRQSIRPTIITEKPAQSRTEQFQNEVLRPVLKLQNELLLAIVQHFIRKRKVKWLSMSLSARLDWIAHSLRHDLKMRALLLGVIIGHFTVAEWQTFQADEAELTRRITDLMIQRLQDQVTALNST